MLHYIDDQEKPVAPQPKKIIIVQKRVDEISGLVIPLTVFTGNLESGAHPVGLGRKS